MKSSSHGRTFINDGLLLTPTEYLKSRMQTKYELWSFLAKWLASVFKVKADMFNFLSNMADGFPTTGWDLYSEMSEPLPATTTHNCHTKPWTKQTAYHALLSMKPYNVGKNTTFDSFDFNIFALNFLLGSPLSLLESESTTTPPILGIIADEPTLKEVTYAFKKLWNGHAVGPDSLHYITYIALPLSYWSASWILWAPQSPHSTIFS